MLLGNPRTGEYDHQFSCRDSGAVDLAERVDYCGIAGKSKVSADSPFDLIIP